MKFIFLLILLIAASIAYGSPDPPTERVLQLYRRADQFYRLTNGTPATDSAALAGFENVLRLLPGLPDFTEKDTLFTYSLLKKGVLLDAAADYPGAIGAYQRVMDRHRGDDSLTFVTRVLAGGVYYNLSNFDSANYFLQKADGMAAGYRNREDEVRLYNTLGVLYYDNGNYQQGINYFSQALRLVESKRPFDTIFAVNLQTNIATSFYRLGLYQDALMLYKKILQYRMGTNFIYVNMGRTYAALDQDPEALSCFRRVDAAKVPAVLNEMAYTQEQLHRPDSCAWYLDRFRAMSLSGKVNALDLGVNQLYRADLLADQQRYREALTVLQQSIRLFSRGFTNTDIFSNPSSFTGTFAYLRLFDALFKKAEVFGGLYRRDPAEKWLLASHEAYTAALSLLRYIEGSYDTDDAKLFLKKKSIRLYDGALAVCLQLHRLHPGSDYLGQAFLISEKSKATIIFANLKENAFTTGLSGADKQAVTAMRNLKYNIARLNIRSEQTTDSTTMETIARQRSDYEISLAKLQKQLERNSAWYKLKYEDADPGLSELQRQLNGEQALVCFYAAEGTLHTFVLTNRSIAYTSNDSISRLQQEVESWVQRLKVTDNGRKFKAGDLGDQLYKKLVKPIQDLTPGQPEWIIVPDGFLYYLPFESLPGGKDVDFLLRTTTISYRLSSRLLSAAPGGNGGAFAHSGGEGSGGDVLSFAPFATGRSAEFPSLPGSRDEIDGLSGLKYIDSSATRANFLKAANHYPIIHLATHAISSLTSAAGSFIAFYPEKARSDENNLYLEELYGLNLDATRLVIISACETGQGELVGKEGVISLSRAFAYAGCASTINSLWKADDKATAFIVKRLYVYLKKGFTKAKALQQAKLDYLSSEDVINKGPGYWAQLVLMGDEEPLYSPVSWWMWGGIFLVLVAGTIGLVRRGKKKKSAIFKA